MKYDECEDCYFRNREPAICDECEDADQFEPEEPDEDAAAVLRQFMKPGAKIIPIRRATFTEEDVREAEEHAIKEAA